MGVLCGLFPRKIKVLQWFEEEGMGGTKAEYWLDREQLVNNESDTSISKFKRVRKRKISL
jgi:hypothetical protein